MRGESERVACMYVPSVQADRLTATYINEKNRRSNLNPQNSPWTVLIFLLSYFSHLYSHEGSYTKAAAAAASESGSGWAREGWEQQASQRVSEPPSVSPDETGKVYGKSPVPAVSVVVVVPAAAVAASAAQS